MGVPADEACVGVTGWQQQVLAASAIVHGDEGWGSGFLVDQRHLLTAAHVVAKQTDAGWVQPACPVDLRFPGGSVIVNQSRIRVPAAADLAIVDLGEQPPTWLPEPVRLSSARRLPDRLALVAYPGADQTAAGVWRSYTQAGPTAAGEVQLRWIEGTGSLPGQSGGPVVDADTGELVGLLVSGWDPKFGDGRFDRILPVREIVAAWPELKLPWLFAGQDARAHFTRRAYGQRSRSRGGDLFRGRQAALDRIKGWIASDRAPGQVLVVTGQPGAGKSAVVGRVALAAESAHPGAGMVFHARGATLGELLDAVAALLGGPTPTGSDSLIDVVAAARLPQPLILLVDALDEAATDEERHAMAGLLTDLARLDSCRVVVATRPLVAGHPFSRDGLLNRLGVTTATAENLIDLDAAYADPDAVERFTQALLSQEGVREPGPPGRAWRVYRDQPAMRDRLAEVIAGRADRNFLVAALTAVPLSEQPDPLDTQAAGFDPSQLPSSAEEALDKYVDALPARDRARFHALLSSLAYAKGSGVSDHLWLQFAQALGYTVGQLDLDELRASAAADFLLQSISDTGGEQTRLFHQALVDQLLPTGRARHRDLAILTRLLEQVRAQGGWESAEPYLLAHTAEHALDAAQLPALLDDPGFVVHTHIARLVAAVTSLPLDQRTPVVAVVLRASDRARGMAPQQRAALFAITAAHLGLMDVRDAFQGESRQWLTPKWGHALEPHQVITGHTDSVYTVALGRLGGHGVVVSGTGDGALRIWDEHGYPIGAPLVGHIGAISAVAVGRLGGRDVIVSGSHDHTVRVWDELGRPVGAPLVGHASAVTAVAIGWRGGRELVVSGDSDGTVRAWDEEGRPVWASLVGHTSSVTAVALGRLGDRELVVSGGSDGLVRVWEELGRPVGEPLTGHEGAVTAVAIGRLGPLDSVVSGGSDGTVRMWDEVGRPIGDPLTGHVGAVTAVAIGQFGERQVVASGGWDCTVRIWGEDGRPEGQPLTGHTSAVYAVAVGHLGSRHVIASGGRDRTVRIWDPPVQPLAQPLAGHDSKVASVAVGRIGERDVIVSGGWDRTVRVWDEEGCPVGQPLTGHTSAVYSVAVGRVSGEDLIISGSDDNTMRIWNERGAQVQHPPTSPERAPVPGARTDTGGTLQGTVTVRLFGNPDNIDITRQYPGPVYAVAVGQLGGRDVIVSGNDDQTVRIWDERGDPIIPPTYGHFRSVRSVAVGRLGGQDVIVSGSRDQSVRIWDQKGHPVGASLIGHHGAVFAVVLGRLGGRDVIVSGGDDRTIRVWDEHGRPVGAPLTGHTGAVMAVAVGRLRGRDVIVSGSEDQTIRVWDEHQQPLGAPYPFLESVASLAFHPLGVVVAAGRSIILMASETH